MRVLVFRLNCLLNLLAVATCQPQIKWIGGADALVPARRVTSPTRGTAHPRSGLARRYVMGIVFAGLLFGYLPLVFAVIDLMRMRFFPFLNPANTLAVNSDTSFEIRS